MATGRLKHSWQRWIVGMGALALVGLLGACASILSMPVSIDYDQDANFYRYATFAFMADDQRPLKRLQRLDDAIDSLVTKRLRRTISDSLMAKGFRQVKRRRADLLISLHLGIKRRVDVTDLPYRHPRGWRHRTLVTHYNEGTLVIDLIDRRQHQLVWRGNAASVWIGGNPASREQLEKAVTTILSHFPPSPEPELGESMQDDAG